MHVSILFWQREKLKKQASPAKTRIRLVLPSGSIDECQSTGIANSFYLSLAIANYEERNERILDCLPVSRKKKITDIHVYYPFDGICEEVIHGYYVLGIMITQCNKS